MEMATPPETLSSSQILIELIKRLIIEKEYDGVALLFTSENEAPRNIESIKEVANDVLHEVCLVHLNDSNYEDNMPLYTCAEELLKILAGNGPAEELLLELLEMVEEQKSDNVFTSALKALQIVLLRLMEQKPRSLEWSLNSICTRIEDLPVPEYLQEGYDLKQQRLLEQNEDVQRLLMNYITIGLFYEPLLVAVKKIPLKSPGVRFNGVDCRNILCCFLVQLLGKPLALLDLSLSEPKTNTYTAQCARNITKAIAECLEDPFYLLSFVEERVLSKPVVDDSPEAYEKSMQNIFMIEEKLPLLGLAVYYYMVLVEGVTVEEFKPTAHPPMEVFKAGIYLATELLSQEEPALHYRGILLAKNLLEKLDKQEIPSADQNLNVHKTFRLALCNIVGYSSQTHIRQQGVKLLRSYILQFDDDGKYMMLKDLLGAVTHTGILGYLAVIYKDLAANALMACNAEGKPLPSSFSGDNFRSIFLQKMCSLPDGIATDLMDQSDRIISSLNAVRFFALKDLDNRTGFWDFRGEVEKNFLQPLWKGLDMTVAHYKMEIQCVERGLDGGNEEEQIRQLEMLDISIANAETKSKSKVNLELTRKRKLEILNQSMCALDLLRSILARTTECVEKSLRERKKITSKLTT